MKYHKIRNIPLKVCTCEQKIAYNSAFTVEINYSAREKYKKCLTGINRTEVADEFIGLCMKAIKNSCSYQDISKKYDIDLIWCALRAGAENYLAGSYSILSSYEEIGKTFPAYYLNSDK